MRPGSRRTRRHRPRLQVSHPQWFRGFVNVASASPVVKSWRVCFCAEGQNRTGDTWFFTSCSERYANSRLNTLATTHGYGRQQIVQQEDGEQAVPSFVVDDTKIRVRAADLTLWACPTPSPGSVKGGCVVCYPVAPRERADGRLGQGARPPLSHCAAATGPIWARLLEPIGCESRWPRRIFLCRTGCHCHARAVMQADGPIGFAT